MNITLQCGSFFFGVVAASVGWGTGIAALLYWLVRGGRFAPFNKFRAKWSTWL